MIIRKYGCHDKGVILCKYYTFRTNIFFLFSLYNNNKNNYKTSIVPISSKQSEFSGAPNPGVGQTHILSSSTNDQVSKCEFSNGDGNKLCYLMT